MAPLRVMAYGGMRITPGIPIGERVSGGPTVGRATGGTDRGVHQAVDRVADHAVDRSADRPTRAEPPLHCWVTHRTGRDHEGGVSRSPGVLVEWQHDGDQWWGLVVFVAEDSGHSMVVTRLVPAETLAPA